MLFALGRERPQNRPLIFVAHSLGGIIVKDVLRRSEDSKEGEIRNVIESTAAIMFMGTPHRGSSEFASLGEIVRKVGSLALRVDSNGAVLRTLGVDSPELEQCRASFTTQWREYGFRVKTFQEALGIGGLNIGKLNDKIVPDTSSSLDDPREHAETIMANHMDMVRFNGREDSGYLKVAGELKHMIQGCHSRPCPFRPGELSRSLLLPSTVNERHSLSITPSHSSLPSTSTKPRSRTPISTKLTKDEKKCLQALAFPQMGVRQNNIKTEMQGTCEWLLQHRLYVEWDRRLNVEKHRGLLWLKGHPGSGKSTLMRKALRTIEEREVDDTIVASYFFNARGAELERSLVGLFQTIMHQILSQDANMRKLFAQKFVIRVVGQGMTQSWDCQELQDFFYSAIVSATVQRIYIFADALDEGQEDEVRGLIRYFRDLTDVAYAAGVELNIFVASRYYPTISVDRCPEIRVDDYNRGDVITYVERRMFSAVPPLPQDLARKLNEKASTVFLWAVLVVELLLRAWDNGDSLEELENQLEILPKQIELVFQTLLNDMTAEERIKSLRLFQIVLFTQQPLTLGELCFSMQCISCPLVARFGAPEDFQFVRQITRFSRGLVEVLSESGESTRQSRTSAEGTIQIIHESVREWFMSGHGFTQLDRALVSNFIEKAHSLILDACIDALLESTQKDETELFAFRPPGVPLAKALHDRVSRHRVNPSLFDYASRNLLTHAQAMEFYGITPVRFVEAFKSSRHSFLHVFRISRKYTTVEMGSALISRSASAEFDPALHIFCEELLYRCVSFMIENGDNPNEQAGEDLDQPLHVALSEWWHGDSCRQNLVKALLDHHADIDGRNGCGATVLMLAAQQSALDILDILIERGADVNALDKFGNSALGWALGSLEGSKALRKKHVERVRKTVTRLLKAGAIVDVSPSEKPLHLAAKLAPVEIIRDIVKKSSDIDIRDDLGRTVLHRAAGVSHLERRLETVEIFIAASADANAVDNIGNTPLHYASCHLDGLRVLKRLYSAGADINALNSEGQAPLHFAAKYGGERVIRSLIEMNADCNQKDKTTLKQTPLDIAIARGRSEAIRIQLGGRFDESSTEQVYSKERWSKLREKLLALEAGEGSDQDGFDPNLFKDFGRSNTPDSDCYQIFRA